MNWKRAVHLIAPIPVIAVLGCAAGQQPTALPPDADPLELARQGLGPFPPERVRLDIEQRVQDLEQSGSDDRGLREHAAKLTDDWKAIAARMGEDVRFGDWECFAAGCFSVSRHAPGGSLTQTLAEFSHSEAFLLWAGGKFQGAPQRSGQGISEVTWILFAPGKDAPVVSPERRFSDFESGASGPNEEREGWR